MGNIPLVERQVGTPRPSRTYYQVPAGLERKTRAKERVAGFLGDVLGKVISGVMKVESDTQYNQAVTETQKATDKFLLQLQDSQLPDQPVTGWGDVPGEMSRKNPDFMGFEQKYIEFRDQARESALEKITMPGLKKTVGSKLDAMFAADNIKVQEIQRQKVIERGKVALNADLEYYVKETRSIEDLTRRANGAAALEYIDHEEAQQIIADNTLIINSSNAFDDAMELSRIGGMDAATGMMLSDKAGEQYDLTYDERINVIDKARRAYNIEFADRKNVQDQTDTAAMWEFERDLDAGRIKLNTADEIAEVFPDVSIAGQTKMWHYVQKFNNERIREAGEISTENRKTTLANINAELTNLGNNQGDPEAVLQRINDYSLQYPADTSGRKELIKAYDDLMDDKVEVSEKKYRSDLRTVMTEQELVGTLRPETITAIGNQIEAAGYTWEGEFVEKWTGKYQAMVKEQEAAAKAAREKSAWETTSPEANAKLALILQRVGNGEMTVQRGQVLAAAEWGPDENGNPRLSTNDFKKAQKEIERWAKTPAHVQNGIDTIDAYFNRKIDSLKDAAQIEQLQNNRDTAKRRFHENAINGKWDAITTQKYTEGMMKVLKAKTGDVMKRRKLQMGMWAWTTKPPEEQMVEWAQQGLLDERGRYYGKSEEEQLQAMGIESFSELDWNYNISLTREYEEAGQRVADISTPSSDFALVTDTNGQFITRNTGAGIEFKVRLNGEIIWLNQIDFPR